MKTFDRMLAWADRRQFVSVRALAMYVTLVITWVAFDWAGHYAYEVVGRPGLEIAAIIAAVTAPVTALQAFVFKWYSESRGDNNANH